MMKLDRIDHIVLTVKNMERTVEFYESVLGMTKETFAQGRVALRFGKQKINLHEFKKEHEPKAYMPTPGSEDLCFITHTELEEAMVHVKAKGVEIIQGPIRRTGAMGAMLSFYFRDPDGNLIEVSQYPME
ncbi:MAG: VOC family protein [Candidatus Thiodiazotropha sp.]